MKTTKGGKVMNPTDAYRKELRKKELKRNKKERKKVREVGILKKDPEAIREQIEKLERMKADGALDKARKHKKRQLEDTLNLVLKKRKEYEEKMRDKGETPVMFSHLGPPRRRATAEEEERDRHPKPEDSVYYHPTLNPTGAPPPGKPPMYKSSIGPRVSLLASSSAAASSSKSETEEALSVPPPPQLPPPLPGADGKTSDDDSILQPSMPLPPPPPAPPKPIANLSSSLPPLPPPGPQPKESVAIPTLLPTPPPPPPPPPQRPLQLPPPVTAGKEADKTADSDGPIIKDSDKATAGLPLPPPPPGLPTKSAQSDNASSESAPSSAPISNYKSQMALLVPPPPREPPPMAHRVSLINPLPPDMMPPAIAHFPPPDLRPLLVAPGISGRPPPPPPPGIVPALIPRPMFAAPPGPPPFLRPPFQLGYPIPQEDDLDALRPSAPQKPSYVKSAASTVVKRPLAQHNPELTAMVPASVRVRRETAAPKAKPKSHPPAMASVSKPSVVTSAAKPETATTSGPKSQSIDDSYMAFLEDMKVLGALDS
ncbi:unnamed protein product [Musa acuminata subsp. malaccensis]|uniref:(wild Malaysian banana) hypothetical protein n=1 Tax=Musa acuminata subsp. malaccensis TaxID=214687 RepID=A0A804JR32_MUSAM|nr:PREDICTED: formin-like protein 3 isoform X1 [Musa acuminata subsp. malaccensis]CAG1855335.1 unnamed protein product [Musa acuminata subsp. malaccensis]